MSHGPSTGGPKAEPNLVPLLDVVLQLIMFFMLTVNFVQNDQVNESIKLPVAQSAVPLDKTVKEVLFLNMNHEGQLVVAGETNLDTRSKEGRAKIKSYLSRQLEQAQRRLAASKNKEDEGKFLVVVRADKRAMYKDVYQLLSLCDDAGYRKWQLRVQSQA